MIIRPNLGADHVLTPESLPLISETEPEKAIEEIDVPVTVDPTPISAEPLRTIGYYKQILMKELDPEVLVNQPSRLIWFFGYAFLAVACLVTLVLVPAPWYARVGLSLLLGAANGAIGLASHELLHGSMIKNQRLQNIFGYFGLLPFAISPTFWRFWHNRLHHGKTQAIIFDPDAFPTLKIYKASRFMRFMFPFTPGSGHMRSYSYFFFWFSFHVFVAQTYLRFRNRIFENMPHGRITLEFLSQICILGAIAVWAGSANLVWVFVVPLFVQNYLVMSYIATNHNLSPLTKVNDPLVNSVTVTNWNWLEPLHLNFGYHVEHHIFPTVPGSKIKSVHTLLKKHFGDQFHVLTKSEAIKKLYSTPRIYKNSKELVHPETMKVYPTL